MNRLADLIRFYELLESLRESVGGTRTLTSLGSFRDWPRRGVYFFFELGEFRRDSGDGLRVVRVGTHALSSASKSTLRDRLRQHRGRISGGGSHRSSIFRLLIGQALSARGCVNSSSSWGLKRDAAKASAAMGIDRSALAAVEAPIEQAVSEYLGSMPFLWLGVGDEPEPANPRSLLERNSIALLSNYGRAALDPPSPGWLGNGSDRPLVRHSGLWNQDHVKEVYDPGFLDIFKDAIKNSKPSFD
jgi:hypothetical protein